MLTGAAATGAIQLYVSIGSRPFDGRKVSVAVRTRAGRMRLAFALRRFSGLLRASAPRMAPRQPCTVRAAVRGSQAATRGPDRPRLAGGGV